MTTIASKGTELQLDIASTFTEVVQLEDVSFGGSAVGFFEAPTLDQASAGIPKVATGYANGGQVSASGYFDPVAATHQAITDLITTPADSSWKVVWSDSANTEWPFTAIVTGFDPSASVSDGLRFELNMEIDGLVTYPT